METQATTQAPPETGADTIVVGVFEDEGIAHDTADRALGALLEAGEARPRFRHLAQTHADGRRWIVMGLGARDAFDPERARIAAALALSRARELGARAVCWELPHHVTDAHAGALVEGTLLAAYDYTAWKSEAPETPAVERLMVSAHHDVSAPAAAARVGAEAANAARDLANAPPNEMTPERLAARARELAERHASLSVEAVGRAEIEAADMGAFAAVARGSDREPQLITLTYDPGDVAGPPLGLIGKAVTFDTGGYSIKPAARMHEMKFDMSGGAAVLEAMGAIARLGLPARVVAVVGATENMVSGRAMRPGDIVRSRKGVSIEINNTDAEGRLVLADCITHALDRGAERLVDIATLTGGIVTTFGPVHAGLMGNDDAWCDTVLAAGEATGERLWRLPLDPLYADMVKGRYADIVNAVEGRKAHSITAAEFLHRFAGDVPWVHLDIAGVSDDLGRPYAVKGASGWGVRLLVEVARAGGGAPDLH
jgi:leucyl aminopeptidase